VKRINARIRKLTPCNWGLSVSACMERVNRYLSGWTEYFRLCTKQGAKDFQRIDAHIRRRIRAIIVRQRKRPRYLYRHLRSRGVPAGSAARTAFRSRGPWKKSNPPGMTRAYPNAWFHQRLVSTWTRWQELNRPAPASGQAALFAL